MARSEQVLGVKRGLELHRANCKASAIKAARAVAKQRAKNRRADERARVAVEKANHDALGLDISYAEVNRRAKDKIEKIGREKRKELMKKFLAGELDKDCAGSLKHSAHKSRGAAFGKGGKLSPHHDNREDRLKQWAQEDKELAVEESYLGE